MTIGPDVYIGKNATIVAFDTVRLERKVLLGENVSIHSEDHGPAGDRMRYTSAPVHVGEEAWIGAGAVIIKGVSIGAGSTVGANAVVTRDVPPGATAVGVPARVINERRS